MKQRTNANQPSLRNLFPRVLLLFTLALFYGVGCIGQSKLAKKGVLDLTKWNWEINGVADLNGEWKFYPDTLFDPSKQNLSPGIQSAYIHVPDFWNANMGRERLFKPAFGYATYTLKILCPHDSQHLELKFLTIASAYKLFVNGTQLLEIGKVGKSANTAKPNFLPSLIPVETVNNELNIVIQVSNFTYNTGGIWDYIKIGTQQQIGKLLIRSLGIDFFIAGSFFLMGIFYLVIFFFNTKRPATLYFSLFCLLLAIRPLVTGELGILYITDWSWGLTKHIEFITLYLTVPVLSLFSYELFPADFSRKILRIILFVSFPFTLLAIFTTPYVFRYGLKPFQLITLLTAIYGVYVYIKAVRNNRPGSIYFVTGFIILFIAIINDILYNSLLIDSVNLIYVGLFILVISQAIALSRQFFRAYAKLDIFNKKLEMINAELNQKNIEIIETNELLTRLNAELDIFVSKASHDLRSPLTSAIALIHLIKDEENPQKKQEYLDMQRRTLHRLHVLITDVLDFSRNKRTLLKPESIHFSELLKIALQDHRFSDNSANVKQITEVKQDGIFISDKSRINMVLYNLISNGLKYYDIAKDNSYLMIAINVTPKEAEIKVIDNGLGIDNVHLNQIFSMFYQVNEASDGTGLGLFIVNEAVQKLSGSIKVDSEIGEGTMFTIVIPNMGQK